MKKVLSIAVALLMLMTMCITPVLAEEPDGSAEHPYYVANPMMAPTSVIIPAHSTVYYQYKAAVFNGWEIGGYGLSAITVDGVVYDELDMWGELYATLNLTLMSPGIVGYVNDTDEEVEIWLNHNEPIGTENNPDELVAGENNFAIPASIPVYYAIYLPLANGEYTFACEQTEDFIVTVDADDDFTDGVYETLNGSMTLTLESYIPVLVTFAPVGITPDVTLTITPPEAGTESNPIWLGVEQMDLAYALNGTEPLYFNVAGSLTGNTLVIDSQNSTDLTVELDGMVYTAEGGALELPLDTEEWVMSLVISQAADAVNELYFSVEYAAGTFDNPIVLVDGDNEIAIPEGGYYYYTYTAEKDGLLVLSPADAAAFDLLDIYYEDAEGVHYGYLAEGASAALLPVPAGQTVSISACGVMDEETFVYGAVDTTLNVVVKDLLLYNTFEGADSMGDLEGWSSSADLVLEEAGEESNVANGFYSAEFNVNKDWGNIYRYISVEPNTDYVVSFKAKALQEKGIWVKFHKEDWTGDIVEASINLTTEWADYEVVLNSGDYASVIMLLQYAGYAADGQVIWLDDILVTKAEAGDTPVVPEPPVADSIVNPDFETGDNTGWETHQSTVIDGDAAHSGSYGAHLKGDGGWGGMLNQAIPAQAGKSYELSFWLKVIKTGVNIQIKDGDWSGANLAGDWVDANAGAEWIQKTYLVTPTTDSIYLNFCGSGASAEDVYVDDVAILELKAPSFDGYIYNGDFETGKTDSWESVWGAAQLTMIKGGHNSDYALKVDADLYQVTRQTVNVEPNTDYVIQVYAKNASNMTLLTKSCPADQNIAQAAINGGDEWTQNSLVFNSGDNTQVYVCVMGNVAGSTAIVDDFFMFKKVPESNDGYLVNGTFETGDIAPWDNLWGSCSTAEVISGGKDSDWALYVVSGEWEHVRQTNIAVEANTNYKITLWAKNANNMNLLIKDGGDSVDIATYAISAGDEWTEIAMEFNTGDYTTIIVSLMGGAGADQYGIFDEIVMEKLTPDHVHEYVEEITIAATCDTPGEKTYTCECGDSYTEEIPAGHTYLYVCDQYCNNCGEQTNPRAKHSILHFEAKEAVNCIEYGNKEYWQCEHCGTAWLDEAGRIQTNLMSVRVAGECISDSPACKDGVCIHCGLPCLAEAEHAYDNEYDADCNNCGEIREVPENPDVPAIVYGDVDGNGSVTNKDLGLIQRYVNGWENVTLNLDAADVDGNGSVTNKDLGLIQRFANGWDIVLGPVQE